MPDRRRDRSRGRRESSRKRDRTPPRDNNPTSSSSSSSCFLCGKAGHLKKDCPGNSQRQGNGCHLCGKVGHLKKDCPDLTCHRCNQKGHFARDCPAGRVVQSPPRRSPSVSPEKEIEMSNALVREKKEERRMMSDDERISPSPTVPLALIVPSTQPTTAMMPMSNVMECDVAGQCGGEGIGEDVTRSIAMSRDTTVTAE